jgi:hypothetical protein
MATSAKISSCVSTHAKKHVPASVNEALKNDKPAEAIEALNSHLTSLFNIQTAIREQKKAAATAFWSEAISKTSAVGIINQAENDPTNELNTFKTFEPSKLAKNLVQRFGSITLAMKQKVFERRTNPAHKKFLAIFNEPTEGFNKTMGLEIERLLKLKGDDKPGDVPTFPFRYEDMLQYFVERYKNREVNKYKAEAQGLLPPPVRAAITATAYEWLGRDGRQSLQQTDSTLERMLRLEKDEYLPDNAMTLLGDVGTDAETLARNMGSLILQRIGIEPSLESDALARERMELSLGFMAIAALESLGYLERQNIIYNYSDTISALIHEAVTQDKKWLDTKIKDNGYSQEVAADIRAAVKKEIGIAWGLGSGTTGVEAMKSGRSVSKLEVTREIKDRKDFLHYKIGTAFRISSEYVKALDKNVPIKAIQEIENNYATLKDKDVFDRLFNSESSHFEIKWRAPKVSGKIGRSHISANSFQKGNLEKYVSIPYDVSQPTMDIFMAMSELIEAEVKDSPEQLALRATMMTMLGMPDTDSMLDVHSKNAVGIQRGIERDWENVENYLRERAERESGVFFIESEFQNNMRMLQRGPINPQNSKMHRNLFSPVGWTTKFNPLKEPNISEAFFEAVALAFDIESLKEGGPAKQRAKLNQLISDDVDTSGWTDEAKKKRAAIRNALRTLQSEGGINSADKAKIVSEAVAAIDNKVHGLKGLVELARYQQFMADGANGDFTTDLYTEIDGVSNGPIIGLLQLIPDSANKQALLAMLAMGGISVQPGDFNIDVELNNEFSNDAYQRVGQVWAKHMAMLREEWTNREDPDEETEQLIADAKAIGNIIGAKSYKDVMDAIDAGGFSALTKSTGVVNKVIRTLSKPRAMQTTYGAGMPKQTRLLAMGDVLHDGIYARVESIIKEQQKFERANPENEGRTSEVAAAEFRQLTADISTLIKAEVDADSFYEDGVLSVKLLKTFKLEAEHVGNLINAVQTTYGESMDSAIREVFGSTMEARAPLNDTVQAAVTMYNSILKTMVETKIAEQQAKLAEKTTPPSAHEQFQAKMITRTDLDVILKEIEHLIPKIKTPFHTEAKPSYLALARPGKNRDYAGTAWVKQIYREDSGIDPLTGTAEGIPYLKNPGMGSMVIAIQMLDSMVANTLMGTGVQFLNNHDGFSHGLRDSSAVRQHANTAFKLIMTNYSLGNAFAEMFEEINEQSVEKYREVSGTANMLLFGSKKGESTTKVGGLIGDQVVSLKKLIDFGLVTEDGVKAKRKEYTKNGVSQDEATEQILLDYFGSPDKMSERVQKYLTKMKDAARKMADQTVANKKEVTDATHWWAQYPHNGRGVRGGKNGKLVNSTGVVFKDWRNGDVLAEGLIDRDRDITQQIAVDMQKFIAAGLGSADGGISTDAELYRKKGTVDTINSMNVTQVYNQLDALDSSDEFGGAKTSEGHKTHLRHVLNDIVAKVMNPLELYRMSHMQNDETKGRWVTLDSGGNRIFIQTQQQSNQPVSGFLGHGIRMTTGEVYVHELVHHITYFGLKHNNEHRKQAYALYDLAYAAFVEKYGETAFRVFMNDPTADITDPANAYDVIAAKERWKYFFNPEQKRSGEHAGLHEFIAFGMTNENFKRELATLEIPPKAERYKRPLLGVFEKNIQQTLLNLYSLIMSYVTEEVSLASSKRRVDQELEHLVVILSQKDSQARTSLFNFVDQQESRLTALGLRLDEKVKARIFGDTTELDAAEKELKEISANPPEVTAPPAEVGAYIERFKAASRRVMEAELAKDNGWLNSTKLGYAFTVAKRIPNMNNILGHKLRVALNWYNNSERGLITSLAAEVQGATVRLQPFIDLLQYRKHALDQAKISNSMRVREVVNGYFEKPLSVAEKSAFTKAFLKPDVSSLLDKAADKNTILGYMINDQQRADRLTVLREKIRNDKALEPFEHYFENTTTDTAFFMIHSAVMDEQGVPFYNARNIVSLNGTSEQDAITGDDFDKAMSIVDEMLTLKAIGYTAMKDRHAMAELIRRDWKGVEQALTHHNTIKAEAKQKLFYGDDTLMMKGYTKQIMNHRIDVKYGTIMDQAEMEANGYTRSVDPLPRDDDDPIGTDIYLYKSWLGGVNDLQTGVASYTQNKTKGTFAYDMMHQQHVAAKTLLDATDQHKDHMRKVMDKKIEKLFKPRNNQRITGKTYMVPQFNKKGTLVELRYMMTEHTKDSLLEQNSEFDRILGGMTAQIIDKSMTPEINSRLISELKRLYLAEHKDYAEAYVEISPWSTNKRYRDIYFQLPPNAQKQIKSEWGEDRMFVHQDIVDIAFGQRHYTILEMLRKSPEERNILEMILTTGIELALSFDNPLYAPPANANQRKGRTLHRAKALEDAAIQMVKWGKSSIVVRNLKIILGNHGSNIMYLKSKGMPLLQIAKYNKEAALGAYQYQKDKYELDVARDRVMIVNNLHSMNAADKQKELRDLQRTILRLEDAIARNPVTELIDRGLMPSIVDDVETGHLQSPYTHGLERGAERLGEWLPAPATKLGKVMFMTEDTESYKMLNNAVRLTDFTARYALFHHYVKKGMSKDEATRRVMDEFINFELPTHRMIDYGNRIGLLWFTKYRLRVLKHVKNVLVDHPVSSLTTFIVGTQFGDTNIINSALGVVTNPTMNFGTFYGGLAATGDTMMIDGVQTMESILNPFQ